MFYSQCLLSSKGPLGNIWVAGYFFKRLKKRQVTDTDIPSSVDKILLEGVPSVTYRILAYLLLGVVRIYSRKVEYLFQDCSETVSDINRFSVGKKTVPLRDIVRSSYSISLPERYELDTFQLEVADATNRDHVSRKEDIILQDAEKDMSNLYSLDKHRFEEIFPHWEDLDYAQTSAEVPKQQETCSHTQTPEKVTSGQETSTFTHTPPDNVVSPHRMEVDMEAVSPNRVKDFEISKGRLRDMSSIQHESMDIDMICELDHELINLVNGYQAQNTVERNEDAQDKAPLENLDHDILEGKEVPGTSSTEKTNGLQVADPAAATTSEFVVVPTPAKAEFIPRPGKRKCLYDVITVLDNEGMKQSINDASALVCKRRKAPHTVIDLWRFHLMPILSKNFVEPLIPCAAMEQENVLSDKKTAARPSLNAAAEPVDTTKAPRKLQVAVSPRAPVDSRSAVAPGTPVDSRSAIAPGTPVQCPTSARVFGVDRPVDSDGEGVHYYDNARKEFFVHEEEHPGPSLIDEMDANEGDSQELHKNKNGWSARTRTVASYLHQVFEKKKEQGKEAVTLLPILKSKSKKENARFFFEVLVLSSGGYVNVVQQKAYGDVILQETPNMEATVQAC